MACETSEELVNFGSLAGAHLYARISLNNIRNCQIRRVVHRLNLSLKAVGTGLPLSRNLRELVLPALTRGMNGSEFIFLNAWSSLSRD
jgi:hypothetical protein